MSKPAWARNDGRRLLDDAQAEQEKRRAAVAADRLRLRGVGALPLDREAAARELGEEQRALSSTRPRTRRWRSLDKHDQAIDELQGKQANAQARVAQAEEALREAPAHDARTLAAWLGGGERGERPAATIYERERDHAAARLLVEALTIKLDQALERRVAHVERHRQKMLEDARKDVDDTRERLLAQARPITGLREELIAARETLTWVAAFPAPAESYGFPAAVALGLRGPVERTLGTTARLEFAALMQALEEDAGALAGSFSAAQKQQLGITEPRTPLKEALWDNDPDHVAWRKAELERARRFGEWQDPEALAAEVRGMRP